MMAKDGFRLPVDVRVPDHVAIIPDGNRRWARARGKHTFFGHKKGFDLVPKLVKAARQMGIHTMTLWAFSTENWDRSQEEIAYLMTMYEGMIDKNLKEAHKEKSKIVHLGRKDRIPKVLAKKIANAEKETQNYTKYILNIALDYGGHDEINRAIGKLVDELLRFKPGDLNRQREGKARPWEEVVGKYANKYPIYGLANYLDTAGQPYPFPDLMIRTSGEHRTSGLLTWQSAYTEFYFADLHFPDFEVDQLVKSILEFSRRRRRFGGNDAGAHLTFDPVKVGQYETQGWRAFYLGQSSLAKKWLLKSTQELYTQLDGQAHQAVAKLLEAEQQMVNNQPKLARQALVAYFELIKQATGFTFDPGRVADIDLKIKNLIFHPREHDDRALVEEQMTEMMAEQFRINHLQATKSAHLKTLALMETKNSMEEQTTHWQHYQDYLTKSYRALKEMVA